MTALLLIVTGVAVLVLAGAVLALAVRIISPPMAIWIPCPDCGRDGAWCDECRGHGVIEAEDTGDDHYLPGGDE